MKKNALEFSIIAVAFCMFAVVGMITKGIGPALAALGLELAFGIVLCRLYALLQDVDGNPLWVSFNTSAPENWVTVADNQGTESYGAVNLNDVIYVHDGLTMYGIEALGGERARTILYIPVDHAAFVIVGAHLTDDLPIEFQLCLRRIGVAHHTNGLPLTIVP